MQKTMIYDHRLRASLTRRPSEAELAEVANRFVRAIAPSIPDLILNHIVETAIWNIFADTNAGCLEVLYEDESWRWPELEEHTKMYIPFSPDIDSRREEERKKRLEWVRTLDLNNWLNNQSMGALREWVREAGSPKARKKSDLIGSLLSSSTRPEKIDIDFQKWKTDLIRHAEDLSESRVVPVFRILALTHNRLRSWAIVHLGSQRPEIQQQERREQDKLNAAKHFHDLRNMNIDVEKQKLQEAFRAELGYSWKRNEAAERTFSKICRKLELRSHMSLQELEQESASFLRDLYWLEVERCPLCKNLGRVIQVADPNNESCLPPYHPSCECTVDWKHEWAKDESCENERGTNFKKTVNEWVKTHIVGIGVAPPTIRDMIAFEEAIMADEMERQKENNLALDSEPWGQV